MQKEERSRQGHTTNKAKQHNTYSVYTCTQTIKQATCIHPNQQVMFKEKRIASCETRTHGHRHSTCTGVSALPPLIISLHAAQLALLYMNVHCTCTCTCSPTPGRPLCMCCQNNIRNQPVTPTCSSPSGAEPYLNHNLHIHVCQTPLSILTRLMKGTKVLTLGAGR